MKTEPKGILSSKQNKDVWHSHKKFSQKEAEGIFSRISVTVMATRGKYDGYTLIRYDYKKNLWMENHGGFTFSPKEVFIWKFIDEPTPDDFKLIGK